MGQREGVEATDLREAITGADGGRDVAGERRGSQPTWTIVAGPAATTASMTARPAPLRGSR